MQYATVNNYLYFMIFICDPKVFCHHLFDCIMTPGPCF